MNRSSVSSSMGNKNSSFLILGNCLSHAASKLLTERFQMKIKSNCSSSTVAHERWTNEVTCCNKNCVLCWSWQSGTWCDCCARTAGSLLLYVCSQYDQSMQAHTLPNSFKYYLTTSGSLSVNTVYTVMLELSLEYFYMLLVSCVL